MGWGCTADAALVVEAIKWLIVRSMICIEVLLGAVSTNSARLAAVYQLQFTVVLAATGTAGSVSFSIGVQIWAELCAQAP
jgi:hypothetical protein